MIVSFKHKGLERLFFEGDQRGIRTDMVANIERRLAALDSAAKVSDMNVPGWNLKQRKGREPRPWEVKVSGAWRILFRWAEGGVHDVDLRQDH